MKKVNLQALTYDRLQQSEMNCLTGGDNDRTIVDPKEGPVLKLYICEYCGRLLRRGEDCPVCIIRLPTPPPAQTH